MSFVALLEGGPLDREEKAIPYQPGERPVLRFPVLPAPPPWPPASPDEVVTWTEVRYEWAGPHRRRPGVWVYRYCEAARHG